MKFSVSTSILLKHLQLINGAASTGSVLPILENFLFEIEENLLIVSATDLQASMTTSMHVEVEAPGKIAIPGKMLLETLRALPEQPIFITVDVATLAVEINAEQGKYKLSGAPGEDFPKIPTIENPSSMVLSSKVLTEAINKTLFAVSTDEARLALTGLSCQLSPEHITFVATDAHKLARYRRTDIHSADFTSFILPKKALSLLKSSLPNEETRVFLNYDRTSAFFSYNQVSLVCRLVDAQCPDYEAVIPKDNPNRLLLDRLSFLSSLRRVVIFASRATSQVKLAISNDQLEISAEDIDFSNEAHERLNCQYEGGDMEIVFNAKFLIEMLATLDSEEIVLEMSTPSRAGLLMPYPSREYEEVLMLAMPFVFQ